MKITVKELNVLNRIKEAHNEENHSDFLSTDAETKSVAGVVSSLFKKNLIYDAYGNWTREDFSDSGMRPFKMWCLTPDGVEIVGKPKHWY